MFVLFGGFTPSDDTSKLGQEFTFPQSQRSEVSVINSPGHISTPFLWMSTGRAVDADRQGCLDKEGSLVRVLQLKAAGVSQGSHTLSLGLGRAVLYVHLVCTND